MKNLYKKLKEKLMSPQDYAKYIGIKFGKDCWIATKNFGSEPYLIEIGDNVRIASRVCFYTHGGMWPFRNMDDELKNIDYFGKIKIGSNVHIGEDAKIMPGVLIGDFCMVGAGSVVTKSVPKGKMVAGNPCRIIGNTKDFIEHKKSIGHKTKNFSDSEKKEYLLKCDDNQFVVKGYFKD